MIARRQREGDSQWKRMETRTAIVRRAMANDERR